MSELHNRRFTDSLPSDSTEKDPFSHEGMFRRLSVTPPGCSVKLRSAELNEYHGRGKTNAQVLAILSEEEGVITPVETDSGVVYNKETVRFGRGKYRQPRHNVDQVLTEVEDRFLEACLDEQSEGGMKKYIKTVLEREMLVSHFQYEMADYSSYADAIADEICPRFIAFLTSILKSSSDGYGNSGTNLGIGIYAVLKDAGAENLRVPRQWANALFSEILSDNSMTKKVKKFLKI